MNKPELSDRAFINVDMETIDYEKDMLNILERVMLRGTDDDFRAIRTFYGNEKIRDIIVHSKCFGPKEISFCCLIFNLKITDFIYYKPGNFKASPEFKDCPDDFEYPNYAFEIIRNAS